ncbi:cytochrome o ubiquinol oxidase subunit I [Bauldia litoralis]|uniref:Cytochrome bo3 quinol oxidase subunit 1 apoprotein n=1 Tax=Bauldia litoralis TaxID=665467 RepID=A0A1G6D2K8_9HYPH|nr:cytochrome o ubiquinol oxidase subunit I [Bauldia litoralis]SDB39350.1 cytochrome bo3 quinol oxidase subunit 1 apoprotein [Bauldia litoralis]
MLGRLTIEALPLYSAVAMGGALITVFGTLAVMAVITWFKAWGYLFREWFTSVDHKKIGIMYVTLALIMLLRGFVDAIMMRTQQAIAVNSEGYLPPDHFDQIFSSHGTIMIFFMAMPFLTGLINIIVPQQIGARDVAFPYMNSMSLWLTAAGAALVMVSLVIGKFSTAGWTAYPPYSGIEYSPYVGVDYWIWAVLISGIGSTLTGINFIVTILKKRAPGMFLMRMPLFTWTALCTAILMAFAFPAITVVATMLELDRVAGMHFFTNGDGGNMMMFANLLWIWGHPEVYILILPAFGIYSSVVTTFSSKRLFGYTSLVWATCAIAILSFTVWLHHFFTMGSSANVNAFFGITTMIIAVPTGVKVFDWLFTMYRGRIRFHVSMMYTIAFIVTFVIGGMTGVLLALPPADYLMHNSTFLVAHFHNMLIPGALFGYFAALNLWFPKAMGFKLDEKWGKRSFWCWVIGFYLAFMPLYLLGFMGMPRRMEHYDTAAWQPWLIVAFVGAVLILFGLAFLIVQIAVSFRNRAALRDWTGDPWHGRTLEWAIASPPPPYNFAVLPKVEGLDAFHMMKDAGTAYQRPARYEDIPMPKNSLFGMAIGAFAFVLGFAAVWHMWWLVAASAILCAVIVIIRASSDNTEYVMTAAEVEAIENQRFEDLAKAPPPDLEHIPVGVPGAPIPGTSS